MGTAQAQTEPNIAYVVSYDSAGIIVSKKCHKIETVEKLLLDKFEKFKSNGVFMDIYIEKKRVTKSGKLKRIKL
jgi:hypothetical protein